MITNLTLLPHDESIVIKDITQKIHYLQLMKHLLDHVFEALCCFETNQLNQFDAQVGETLCQIRAYKMYMLASSPCFIRENAQLKKDVTSVLHTIDYQLTQYQHYLKLNKNQRPETIREQTTLIDFFSNLGCVISLSDNALYSFLSYFLCRYHQVDEDNIPVAINFSDMSQSLKLSRSYTKKLGHFYQKKLSELSCHFMFTLLEELDEVDDLKQVLPWLHLQSDEGRMALPCYAVTDIIIRHMIQSNANLLLLIDFLTEDTKVRKALYFKGDRELGQFQCMQLTEQTINTPCLVMYGTSSLCLDRLLTTLSTSGVEAIILSNNASHPQYSGSTLAAYRYDPYTMLLQNEPNALSLVEVNLLNQLSRALLTRKQQADDLGCSLNNQELFLLKHIFCDALSDYVTLLETSFFLPTKDRSVEYSTQPIYA
ncbi:hypothetical protein [Legionella fairfieldensis]|uniref:hypothetical protein n=2 Tax=Legionella fairfieldensis TaxID=45064 RepID=UPI0010419A67|nr:hypothetical protein [Legionella fairfieldensis]